MTKKPSNEAVPAEDPLDQVIFTLDDEQTRKFLEIMVNSHLQLTPFGQS